MMIENTAADNFSNNHDNSDESNDNDNDNDIWSPDHLLWPTITVTITTTIYNSDNNNI